MQFLPLGVPQNFSPKPGAAASVKSLFWFADCGPQKKISFPYGPARDGTGYFPANGAVFEPGFMMKDDLKKLWLAVLVGGTAAGAMDIISAVAGKDVLRVLQYIGSGLIGKIAFDGGWWTGAAGLAVHFGLTIIMAALFVLAARRWTILLKQTWLTGMVYGAVIYVAMFYFIVPVLTAATNWKTPQGFLPNLKGAMLHGLLVGLPIAAAARHYMGKRDAV